MYNSEVIFRPRVIKYQRNVGKYVKEIYLFIHSFDKPGPYVKIPNEIYLSEYTRTAV